jgi:ferrochelatase
VKTGVLLVNTGTPTAPTARAVRLFLQRFLGDPRVVELPRWFWLPLLNFLILPLRSPRSARNYQRIWTDAGSPLAVFSLRLCTALQALLDSEQRDRFVVEQSYLYADPTVPDAVDKLRAAGVTRLVVLPMYPQCSGTTTGAVYDQVSEVMSRRREMPELRLIADYHADAGYINALASSVREHWSARGSGHLLISFHGIPQALIQKGDAYERHCRSTAQLLATALQLDPANWTLSFQSRFGGAKWLEPATDATLARLGASGTERIDVLCPGFAVDCLETLEEIAITGREIFLHAGGKRLDYIPCLNERADHVAALARIITATPDAQD